MSLIKKIGNLTGLSLNEIIDRDFGELKITKDNKDEIIKNAQRYGGSVRMQMGLFYTNEEYEKYREKVLSKLLP